MTAKWKDFGEWLNKYDDNEYFRDEELGYLHDAWNAAREGMPDPEAVRALVEAAWRADKWLGYAGYQEDMPARKYLRATLAPFTPPKGKDEAK